MPSLTVTLHFEGPVLSTGVGARVLGLDAEMRRACDGTRMLPASHIKGRLREAVCDLVMMGNTSGGKVAKDRYARAQERLSRYFGGASAQGTKRAVVDFDDFYEGSGPRTSATAESPWIEPKQETGSRLHIANRVAIDRRTGTAREAALGFLEAAPVGFRSRFRGLLHVPENVPPPLTSSELLDLLAWGFRWLRHVGSHTSSGWGLVRDREIDPEPKTAIDELVKKLWEADGPRAATHHQMGFHPQPVPAATGYLGVILMLQSPLLVGDDDVTSNVFTGRIDAPGSVMRRALADALLRAAGRSAGGWVDETLEPNLTGTEFASLARRFSEIQASFAMPLSVYDQRGELGFDRPWRLPHTVFQNPDQCIGDSLLERVPPADETLADPDRKYRIDGGSGGPNGFADASRVNPRRDGVPKVLITHVKIDGRTRAPEHEHLFSTQPIADASRHPRDTGEHQLARTRLHVRLLCPADLATSARMLLAQVPSMGKATGRGYGRFEVFDAAAKPDNWEDRLCRWNDLLQRRNKHGGRAGVPVMLNTPVLLLMPFRHEVGEDLTSAYTEAWKEACPKLPIAEVDVVMAHHLLTGGRTARGPGAVPPAISTGAGSIFHLRLATSDLSSVRDALAEVAVAGVERTSAIEATASRWGRHLPYGRADGYGEIVLAHPVHLCGMEEEECVEPRQ